MGANRSQAVAITAFLLGFTFLAAAFYAGGVILYLPAIVLLAGSIAVFLKCKPLEFSEN